jgi:hypothetical protein
MTDRHRVADADAGALDLPHNRPHTDHRRSRTVMGCGRGDMACPIRKLFCRSRGLPRLAGELSGAF